MKVRSGGPRGGFTLVELLLVLLLLSLAGALVYPNLRPHLQRTGQEAALRRLSRSLDDLRREAVAGGRTLRLSYGGEDTLLVASGEAKPAEGEALPLSPGLRVYSMEPPLLYYYPQGHSSGAALRAGADPERSSLIRVGSFTGLARIVREGPD